MSTGDWSHKRVLAIGKGIAALVQEALPGARLETAGCDRDEALAALSAGPQLVLLDADAASPELAREIIDAVAARLDQPALLLMGAHLPTGIVRALLKLERSDVVETPVLAADLARAASLAFAELAPPPAPTQHARCWSVVGAVGGSGATTLSIELAAALARRSTQPGAVALVDLNLADGATAGYLGAPANMRLDEASGLAERMDAAMLDAFSVRVDAGFDLLAAPRDPHAFHRISPVSVCRLLEIACQAYSWVVVDQPRLRQPWSLDVLSGSDEIIIVSELTVPALLSARALAGEIEAELPDARRPRLILNRMSNRAFGPAPSRAEAEKALQRKVDGAVTSDWEAAACSVNLGGPISQHRPRSKIVKDVAAIVDRLAVQGSAAPERAQRSA